MQTAETLLAVIRKRGTKGQPIERVYRMLYNKELYLKAYAKLYPNKGAMTPGVTPETADGMSTDKIDSIIEAIKYERYQWKPVKRTYIKKTNGKLRPLGLPTWSDKLLQEVIRSILDAYYDPQFSEYSHGFRQSRGCHTALQELRHTWRGTKWFIEGDISQYFDRIHHKKLVELVGKRIADKRVVQLIDAFLKAGVMEDGLFQETPEGTPQGGILSPLLANIYLHELDRWWWEKYGGLSQQERSKRRQRKEGNFILTRYADDFIFLCNGTKESAKQIKQEVKDFLLNELHLELSEEKTRITHVTEGFDFLGFHVQREEPKDNKPWLRVTPTHKSEQRLRDTIQRMTDRALVWEPVPDKLNAINRVLRGWGNYYKNVSSSLIRSKLDWYVSQRMLKWLGERHKGMGKRAILKKYYIRQGKRKNWGCKDGQEMVYLFMLRDIQHSNYPRKRRNNPYLEDNPNPNFELETPHIDAWDGTTSRRKAEWWEARNQALIRDNHRCTHCGSTEELEVHHLKPSGGNSLDNLQTLCQKCHEQTPSYGIDRRPN